MSCPDEQTFLAFLDGNQSAEDRQRFQYHVEGCSRCRQLLSALVQDQPPQLSGPPTLVDETRNDTRELPTGSAVGRFVTLKRLGEGGMGVVYSAYDPELDRNVAIKFLRDKGTKSGVQPRLLREAQAMARLAHPNVVAVFDVGTHLGKVFIAMELVEGQTLLEWLLERPRSWRSILNVFVQAGEGLAAAHRAGLVHRDFKPTNVMISATDRIHVTDFGLARPAIMKSDFEVGIEAPAQRADESDPSPLSTPLTRTGEVLGTPAYMAPEQRQGEAADARSDQYSFCVALYEALSGERPSEKKEPGFPPGDKRTPVFIQRILSRGLDPNRDRRFPDMSTLLSELSRDPRQKRRRVMAVLAVIFFLALLVSGAYLGIQSDTQKCKDAGQAVLSAWNPTRKATVRRVFLASGAVFARDAADVVENQLDRFSADWTAMHAEACEATYLRGELSETFLDARMLCLRRRLDEVKALVDVFEQAGNVVIGDAAGAVHDLDNLQDCADVPALLARQALPRGEKARALVEEQQSRISRVQALLHTGQYAEGLALAEDIVEDIEGTTYKPLEAEAMFMQGRLQHKTGDLQAGEKSMYKALWAAEAGHHDTLAARAWTELVLLVGYELARHEEGHRLYKHARAAVDRAGRPAEIEATLLFYAGRIFLAEAKWKQAADLFQKAEERFRKAVRSDHPLLAMIINSRGTVHYFKGEYDKTSKCYLKSLAIRQRVFGQRHPEVGKSYNNLGNVLTARDKYEEALESYEKALDNYQQSLEPNHSHIAHVRTNIGLALMDLGRYEKAIKHHQFAVEALSRSLGEDHPKVAVALNSLGLAWLRMGRHNEAIESLERSRKITINKYGTDHPNVAMALRNLGMAYGDLGKQETAIKNLQEALRINTKSYGPEHINLSYLQYDIGSLLFRQGKLQPALEKFLIALDLHERTSGKDNPCHYVWLLHRIALVYNRLGQTAEAKQYVERALTLEKTVLSDSIDLASARFRLAKLLRKLGTDRERAKDLAVKAKTVFVKAGSGHSADLKEVTEWLEKHR